MEKEKSYFRKLIEEKGLEDEIIEVDHNNTTHLIEMTVLIELMEKASPKEKKFIHDTLFRIDFLNGDIMHFLNHLAKSYVIENFSNIHR